MIGVGGRGIVASVFFGVFNAWMVVVAHVVDRSG
jgi:hypothetical protein